MPNTKNPQQNKQINNLPPKNHTIILNSSSETEEIHNDFAVLNGSIWKVWVVLKNVFEFISSQRNN